MRMIDYDYPTWLVPIETARKLKKLNFDLPSPFVLRYGKVVFLTSYAFYTESGVIDLEIEIDKELERTNDIIRRKDKYKNLEEDDYEEDGYNRITVVPTWEQVIEWFIDKNLIGTIEYRKFDEKDPYYAYCITNKMTKVLDYSSNTTRYKTYREAREALVNKLIEIYKKQ